ncbi:hypothetical protein CLOBOL_00518 [Enterocloster bolteae ATCC BAA-613]|uniref:Uncharacterized protein n=1 Tax=Enterocloster bolteae (strain ATCC BAA-613 / DSM 15670 / CCUG 46953 / JCM 12243 / WAL 16351) TaxID=411902 RepID=A8RHV7_ENTBW|nr:hypothetical protein CLOBOL_00518 [Enterocloster bolteae ATCC BAA-613]
MTSIIFSENQRGNPVKIITKNAKISLDLHVPICYT